MNYVRWVSRLASGLACSLACVTAGVSVGLVGCGGASSAGAGTTPSEAAEASPAEGGDVTAEVHRRGAEKLIVVVGPPGGTLELDNGARLVIPAGALTESVEVTFAQGSRTTAFSNHDYERAFGPTLEIALDSNLQIPVQVSVPDTKLPDGFTEKDLAIGVEVQSSTQRAVQGQGTQTHWDYLDAKAGAGRALAELRQVPGYRVQFIVSKSE